MTRLENKLIEQAKLLIPFCYGRGRHISFLVRRNRTWAIGINNYSKTSRLGSRFGHRNSNIHSELSCIVHFPKNQDITKCTLYNVRIKPSGDTGISRPCKHCQKLIYAFGIKKVMYTTDFGYFEEWEGE